MEILDSFDFDGRPSRSRYRPVVEALVEKGKFAVRLKRGEEMFPAEVKVDTVQAGARTAITKAGKRARTTIVSPDEIVIGLHPDQNPRKRNGRKREAVTA